MECSYSGIHAPSESLDQNDFKRSDNDNHVAFISVCEPGSLCRGWGHVDSPWHVCFACISNFTFSFTVVGGDDNDNDDDAIVAAADVVLLFLLLMMMM